MDNYYKLLKNEKDFFFVKIMTLFQQNDLPRKKKLKIRKMPFTKTISRKNKNLFLEIFMKVGYRKNCLYNFS